MDHELETIKKALDALRVFDIHSMPWPVPRSKVISVLIEQGHTITFYDDYILIS